MANLDDVWTRWYKWMQRKPGRWTQFPDPPGYPIDVYRTAREDDGPPVGTICEGLLENEWRGDDPRVHQCGRNEYWLRERTMDEIRQTLVCRHVAEWDDTAIIELSPYYCNVDDDDELMVTVLEWKLQDSLHEVQRIVSAETQLLNPLIAIVRLYLQIF